ncbi:hypothetical protein GCM10017714_10380 [Curtobacterium pusillum]|uniref:hypothetical protein n=1 Tax=Curtobacterium pusillum TaxID=69373 RepID=UPI002329B319|nr:hypothetical protein GCM10017610_05830 [Curtobacterium pusillum]
MRFQLLDIVPYQEDPDAGPFLSAAPSVLLGALAASTSRIRLQTGVTVLSILDPRRSRAAQADWAGDSPPVRPVRAYRDAPPVDRRVPC